MHLLVPCSSCAVVCAALLSAHAAVQPNAANPKIPTSQFPGHTIAAQDHPFSSAEAAKSFIVPDDLEIELVLAEPIIRQPVFLNFDERGRMWVVQYL